MRESSSDENTIWVDPGTVGIREAQQISRWLLILQQLRPSTCGIAAILALYWRSTGVARQDHDLVLAAMIAVTLITVGAEFLGGRREYGETKRARALELAHPGADTGDA